IVELSARTLSSPRASVWFQETAGGEISVRATHGYPELDRERLARLHFDHERAVAFLEGKEPFVASDEQITAMDGVGEVAVGKPFAIAPLPLAGGRLGCIGLTVPH